jgi:hypothetical protein
MWPKKATVPGASL